MKFNKWTIGLAGVGLVSLVSAAQAEEKMNAVQSALSSTIISGYVDTSAQWNVGTGNGAAAYKFGNGKADGFNLNVVQLSIAKPLDESEWASGYKVDLWFGPDAVTLGTQTAGGDVAIRQAYIALRTPVGNGIDWKIGAFDTIIGYESVEAGNNPNFTRSYGHSIEPQTHTGILGTYRVCESVAFALGVANTTGNAINAKAQNNAVNPKAESYKTYMGSIAVTAPESTGFLAGSTMYLGFVNGFGPTGSLGGLNGAGNQTSYYVGGTMNTPVAGLKFGAAYDLLDYHKQTGSPGIAGAPLGDAWAFSLYGSYQATEKLSFHVRGELAEITDGRAIPVAGLPAKDNRQIWSLTSTIQYDLWKNVISRLEVRWDHADEGNYFTGGPNPGVPSGVRNSVLVAANLIYKF